MERYSLDESIGRHQAWCGYIELPYRTGYLAVRVFLLPLFAAKKPMAGTDQAACLDGCVLMVRLGRHARRPLVLDIALPAVDAFLYWLTNNRSLRRPSKRLTIFIAARGYFILHSSYQVSTSHASDSGANSNSNTSLLSIKLYRSKPRK